MMSNSRLSTSISATDWPRCHASNDASPRSAYGAKKLASLRSHNNRRSKSNKHSHTSSVMTRPHQQHQQHRVSRTRSRKCGARPTISRTMASSSRGASGSNVARSWTPRLLASESSLLDAAHKYSTVPAPAPCCRAHNRESPWSSPTHRPRSRAPSVLRQKTRRAASASRLRTTPMRAAAAIIERDVIIAKRAPIALANEAGNASSRTRMRILIQYDLELVCV